MSRLLTEKEMFGVMFSGSQNPDAKRLAEAQDAKTLKAVGEWLNTNWVVTEGNHIKDARFANKVIERLLQGKMPDG